MDVPDRNFYHSFPRVHHGDSRESSIGIGVEILKSIQQIGLVLAPEVLTWKQPLESGEDRIINTRQRRICFTELSRKELKAHARKFGPFSLEFRTGDLRRIGALPVIYMPQHLKEDRAFSSAGATVVTQLRDIRYTIECLHRLSQASITDDPFVKLTNVDSMNNVVASYDVPSQSIRDILSHIGYGNAPLGLMFGVLSYLQSLFYPTDDEIHDKQLEYYRQREWRLASGLIVDGKPQSRLLTDEEKHTLLSIDERFWSKEISVGKFQFRRVDDAFVIDNFDDRHIAETISSVIVPVEAYDEAKSLFGNKVQVLDSAEKD